MIYGHVPSVTEQRHCYNPDFGDAVVQLGLSSKDCISSTLFLVRHLLSHHRSHLPTFAIIIPI